MDQLKKALIRAGFESREQQKLVERKLKKLPVSKDGAGHIIRSQCENCGRFTPDVEKYRHANKLVKGNWLCMRCADDNNIDDECRLTAQSPYSRQGLFIRQYGKTKVFS